MKRGNGKSEPSTKDVLAAAFDKALQEDFANFGASAIIEMRKKHPEKYCDITNKRITQAVEIPSEHKLHSSDSTRDIAAKVLRSVGLLEPDGDSIDEAIKANDVYVSALEKIVARANGSGDE
jgi:hypothetical protein